MNEYNPVCLYCGKNIKGKVGQFCSKEHAELWEVTDEFEGDE